MGELEQLRAEVARLQAESDRLAAEARETRDALAVVVGSLRMAAEKERESAPCSAASHRDEALRVAGLQASRLTGDHRYEPGQSIFRTAARLEDEVARLKRGDFTPEEVRGLEARAGRPWPYPVPWPVAASPT